MRNKETEKKWTDVTKYYFRGKTQEKLKLNHVKIEKQSVSHAESPPWNYYKSLFIIIIFIRNILRKLQWQSFYSKMIDRHKKIVVWYQCIALFLLLKRSLPSIVLQARIKILALAKLMIATDPNISVYSVNSANMFPEKVIFSSDRRDRIFSSFCFIINQLGQSVIANFQIITWIKAPKKDSFKTFSW